ncbi:hypothetical protein HPB50_011854 [Hyalomma asiaticum]|uniref:Uncharacterized protein n=1 Tax=Hyalomma asiaticum TaxID=266040 RepID=A0ACB7SGN7_HYAAI|nr:hypothetical protein HPB50_011854 [Hyalomma asiaticum]
MQDRCWTIPVIAACVTSLISVVDSSRGYLYVLYIDTYQISRGAASWPDSIQMVTQNLSGLAFGAALTCLSLYSLLYFTKYRGAATSAKFAAWSVAGLVWPSFTSFLAENYGLHGALLLCGGCILQAGPFIMLLKRPRPLTCCFKTRINDEESTCAANMQRPETQRQTGTPTPSSARPTEASMRSTYESAHITLSWESLKTLIGIPEFYILTLLYVVFDWCQSVFLTTAADYALDKGATLEKAKYVLTAVALGSLVGRTAMPLAADRIPFSRAPFAVVCLVASLLAFVAASLSTSFHYFVAFSTLLGMFQGYVMCMRTVLFSDYLGIQYVPITFGIAGLILVPLSFSSPSVLGAFRDILGSYDNLYRVLGALDFSGAMLLFLLVYRDWSRRRKWEVNNGTAVTSNDTAID